MSNNDTSFTPLENPDLSTFNPSDIGVDTTITTQSINDRLQPLSLIDNFLNVNKETVFKNNITVVGTIFNPTLYNAILGLNTSLNLKAPIDNPTFTGTVNGITKAMIGLGDVNNL